jgi:L-alanine-DL-glutamate epimerase-like enolase superfamily enzyme
MKITRTETAILRIPEDDPLADMPEEAGRLRPIVILRIQTDNGIEGIGLTFYGGALTGTLRSAVDELCALLIGEDPIRIEAILRKLRAAAGDSCGSGIYTLAQSAIDVALWDIKGKALEQPLEAAGRHA